METLSLAMMMANNTAGGWFLFRGSPETGLVDMSAWEFQVGYYGELILELY